MFYVVAISTKNYKIVRVKISFLMVRMMNNKGIDIIKPTSFTFDNPMPSKAGSITKRPITCLGMQCSVNDISAVMGTVPAFSTLIFIPACNYLTTQLARFSLKTRQGTIIFSSAKFIYSKLFATGRTYLLDIGVSILAFSGAVNLSLTRSSIMSLEWFITNFTVIHTSIITHIKDGYKGVYYPIT